MIVSINQPAYLPWLGYFDRISRSDLHIVLDNVQIERNTKHSFTNRNKVRTIQGWSWLTVPLRRATTASEELINGVRIDGDAWLRKHSRTLAQSYGQAAHFQEHRDYFQELYAQNWTHLAPLLRESTRYLLKALGIRTPLLFSTEMKVEGRKAELVVNLCKAAGATVYLSGPLGRDYLDAATFEAAGIILQFHDYTHPMYSQMHRGFVPYMSVVDLLFNHGADSQRILRSGSPT